MAKGRILAVEIDEALFDRLDELLDELLDDEHLTKKKYISELLSKDLGQRMQLKAQQSENLEIKHADDRKVWDRVEVIDAIDDFMLKNRRIPKQTEFKNENGLPSYGAAGRAIEMSPAEYMRGRYDELSIVLDVVHREIRNNEIYKKIANGEINENIVKGSEK